ncbi:12821_t:CDS:2, partial [Racocetra persica]
ANIYRSRSLGDQSTELNITIKGIRNENVLTENHYDRKKNG